MKNFLKRFEIKLLIHTVILVILVGLLYYMYHNFHFYITLFALFCLIISQLIVMLYHIRAVKIEALKIYDSLQKNNIDTHTVPQYLKNTFPEMALIYQELLHHQQRAMVQEETTFMLLKSIMERIKIGLIVLKIQGNIEEEIILQNEAANLLLHIPKFKLWKRFEQYHPQFCQQIIPIQNGGKNIVEYYFKDEFVQLSVEIIKTQLFKQEYRIITFQNIKDEIEQKEIETWNKLIQVISHELLNSITPIISLSQTLNDRVNQPDSLSQEDMDDLKLGLHTIYNRSNNLVHFVNDYRLIAELPSPKLEPHAIADLFIHIKSLMLPQLMRKNISLILPQTLSKTTINIDIKLIEQVLINLISNSVFALENISQPTIKLSHYLKNDKIHLEVSDNGKGISPDEMNHIFIPFYTTKEKGSGIGLTITKNIIKMHPNTHIEVQSVPFERTSFTLVFGK